ncbi:MAG: phosphatase PAP2 family protein [Acidobacteriia bacterium]|nr:phosphatase PAP2 family protein [Terriglobia bacterium]
MYAGSAQRVLWPVDKVVLTFLAGASVVIVAWWRALPYAPALIGLHLAGASLVLFAAAHNNRATWIFRNWYPVFYVAACYKEMDLLVPAVRSWDADQWLAGLDYSLWHANPTVWLERIQSPALSEYLQVVYTLFVPAVLFPAFLLWQRRRYTEFHYFAFLIALGYLVSYVGYMLVPARGPRFLLRDLQHQPLEGLWLFHAMQGGLDRLESIAYDCFPSGHTELTILACCSVCKWFRPLSWPYFTYTSSIIFATVYLRYHYTVDVLAGAAVAVVLLVAAPSLYRRLNGKGA